MEAVTETEVLNLIREIVKNRQHDTSGYEIMRETKLDVILDSLDYVELVMDIEVHYNTAIPDELCNDHAYFGDLIKTVLKVVNDGIPDKKAPFQAFNHGKGPINLTHWIVSPVEFRPVEIHLKEDGALDNTPSFCIVMVSHHLNPVSGQITLKMLNEGLRELGYEIKPLKK